MIVRCPHCGAADTAAYRPGRAPKKHRCSFCGEVFAFFPALEIELAGQPRIPALADLGHSSPHPATLRADRGTPAVPPSPLAPLHAHSAHGTRSSEGPAPHRPLDWPLRLAGLLAGLTLIATLAAQVLVHQRAMLQPHPELLGLSNALCRTFSCPDPVWRQPAAIAIGALRPDPLPGDLLGVEMEIHNTLDRKQPWPLLEMALSDRFGRILAQGRWHPSEYLGPAGAGMMGAGEVRRLRLVISAPVRLPDGVVVWAL
jgi:hypothetical protein